MGDFSSKVKVGIGWSFILQGYTLLLKFTLGIWLARILGPGAFGTVGMITVFSGLATILVDFGLTSALIQKKNPTQVDYSTVFWMNMLISFSFFIVFYISSPWIADFYNKAELGPLVKVLGAKFILSTFAITQRVQLTRRIDFRSLAFISIVSSSIAMVVALVLAYMDFGVWALVVQTLVESVCEIVLLKVKLNWAPSFVFSMSSLKGVSSFGLNVTADTSLSYFSRNFDNFLIGKVIGDASLGVYSKAYALILFPITNLSNVIKKVLFPSFSLMQSNIDDIKRYYLRVTNFISYIVFPMMAFIAMKAHQLVLLTLGEQWISMVPLMEVFGFLGMVQSVLTLNGTIYLSQGKANLAFRVGIFSKSVTMLSVLVGLYTGGLIGVAYGLVAAQLICFYPVFKTAANLIDLTLKEQFRNLYKIAISTLIASLLLFVFPRITASYLVDVLSSLTLFVFVYLLLNYVLKVESFLLTLRMVRNAFSASSSS